MKGKISDINDLVTQPLKMFGALLYGPNKIVVVQKRIVQIITYIGISN